MTTPHPRKIAASVIGFLFSFVLALAAPIKFEIPAQPAPAALKAYVKQSNQQVVFNPAEMEGVNANEVRGSFEPAEALNILLKGTGFNATKGKGGIFMVKKVDAPATTGAVRGSLTGEGGKGLANVLVAIRETAQSTETDRYGVYAFPNVAAGTYVLVATASGYQPLHITDVNVKAGRELTLGKEEMRKAGEGVLALEPFLVHADTVEELEKFEVTGQKTAPFTTANVDIPRTIDDPQAYYIFDSKTIEQSGATNVEGFLKTRLTMNTNAFSNSQMAYRQGVFLFPGTNSGGQIPGQTNSVITLRGLAEDETLILINGRRPAGGSVSGLGNNITGQPDLNGIPLAAIDHIEVLPSSASAIYGGNALGGVINVVLKRDYSGAELRATYNNTFDRDAPNRTLSLTAGMALEGGKTNVTASASFSDQGTMLFQDRQKLARDALNQILQNSPSFIYSGFVPFQGATPNISAGRATRHLVLLNGTDLGSNITFVPPGYAGPASDGGAALVANAGRYNLNFPDTNTSPTGLRQPLGSAQKTQAYMVNMRRQMTAKLELFIDYSYIKNSGAEMANPFGFGSHGIDFIPAGDPRNPFMQNIRVTYPFSIPSVEFPAKTQSIREGFTAGFTLKLQHEWKVEGDYAWTGNRHAGTYPGYDGFRFFADESSGVFSVLADRAVYPIPNLSSYVVNVGYGGQASSNELALRTAGPLWTSSLGTTSLAAGAVHRLEGTRDSYTYSAAPNDPANAFYNFYNSGPGRNQTTNSAYAELLTPLVKKASSIPGVHDLELQVAARLDNYDVGTATGSVQTSLGSTVVTPPPIINSKSKYTSSNPTIGLRWTFLEGFTLRASYATGFRPPSFDQLLPGSLSTGTSFVNDPKRPGDSYGVQTFSGGNPNLQPEKSRTWAAGVVLKPDFLKGLRVSLDYTRIEKRNAIATLFTQDIVNNENLLASRVTRGPVMPGDSFTVGRITLVDTTTANLNKLIVETYDASLDYRLPTSSFGTFDLYALASWEEHFKQQISFGSPFQENVNAPGLYLLKFKSNAGLTWEKGRWTAGWLTQYTPSYLIATDSLDPNALAQGGLRVSSQIYHDAFVSYRVGTVRKDAPWYNRLLDRTDIQLGVKNLFNKAPPLDVLSANTFYTSPYGSYRLREYTVSIRKQF